MDWAVLLKDIGEEMPYHEIAEIVGRSRGSIASIANDLHEAPAEWDAAFKLIDLWWGLHANNNKLPVKE